MNLRKLFVLVAALVWALLGHGTAWATSMYFVQTDHLNTPRAVTNENNVLVWKWDSDPYGAAPPNESPSGAPAFAFGLRFPGQVFDRESYLYYNYYRDYDPQTGRYVQSDPIGLDGGINTYGYAGGNPLSNVDPTGEFFFAIPAVYWAGGAIAAGGAIWWSSNHQPQQASQYDRDVYMAMVQDANEARAAAQPVSYPERSKGQYTCTCRVNKDGRCRDNYSNNNLESAQATASGPTVQAAKKAAEKAAKDILGAKSTHHPTCRCTGPKGDQIIPTR